MDEDLIDGRGKLIIGFYAGATGSEVVTIGLYAISHTKTKVIEEAPKTRTFTSADGVHAMTAGYVSKTATHVRLRASTGSETDVEIKMLCAEDQAWIESRE